MTTKLTTTLVHVMALLSGVCSLLAVGLTAPPFSVSPLFAGGLALAATVLTYLANGLPAIGGSDVPAPAPPHG